MPTTSDDQQNEFDDESEFNLGLKEEKEDPELPELLVFQQYKFGLSPTKLPILEKREEILKVIEQNMVEVLTATTGTGKWVKTFLENFLVFISFSFSQIFSSASVHSWERLQEEEELQHHRDSIQTHRW